jgi:drug/metabolite transporter (DMT)-like permease
MFIWGSPPTVARAVSGAVPPIALTFARWFIALLVLLPFVWRQLWRELPLLRQHGRSLVVLAMSMTAGSSLSVIAVYYTTATNAVLVNASQPALTALLAWVVARERLTSRQGTGIALAFFGILVMICRADIGVLVTLDINVGDLLMLSAVVGWSIYAVKLHHCAYLPSSELLLCLIALFGTLVLFPAYLIEASTVGDFALTTEVLAAMCYLALFPTLLATYSWNLAIRSVGANRAAIFVNLIPVFGAVFAMVFLGERLFLYHLAGAAFVFLGIFLATRLR